MSEQQPSPAPHHSLKVHQHLDAPARNHRLERLLEVFDRELVRDDLIELKPSGQQHRFHLVPRVPHAATIDAQDLAALKNHMLVEVEVDPLGRQAQQRCGAPIAKNPESLIQCCIRVDVSVELKMSMSAYFEAARI